MSSYLDFWGEAVARTGAAGGDTICVSGGIAAALKLTGNEAALAVYALLVHQVAHGRPTTVDSLAAVIDDSDTGRARVRTAVAFLFVEGMIPALVAVEAGATAPVGNVIPQ